MCTEILGHTEQIQTSDKSAETPVKSAENSKAQLYYYIMQKLIGIILFELGALTIPLSEGDGTAFIMMLLFSLPLIFSKEKILMINYYNEESKKSETDNV